MKLKKGDLIDFMTVLFHFMVGFFCFIPAMILGTFVLFNEGPGYSESVELKGIWFAFIFFSAIVLIFLIIYKRKIPGYLTYWTVLYMLCMGAVLAMTLLSLYN